MKNRSHRKWKVVLLAGLVCAGFSGVVLAGDYEDGMDFYRKGNFEKAAEFLDRAALSGHAEATAQLCVMYRDGKGVKQSDNGAEKLCEKAAQAGSAKGQYILGMMYEKGLGTTVKKNEVTALRWYSKAGDQGHVKAQLKIGDIFCDGRGIKQDYAQAMKWYRKAADQGDTDAMNKIGKLYSEGKGVKRDEAEAMVWYQYATQQDNVSLQKTASSPSMYVNNNNTRKDQAEAVRVYREAARQGMPEAQYMLGIAYAEGEGIPKNHAEAMKWLEMAASNGHEDAKKKLAQMKK